MAKEHYFLLGKKEDKILRGRQLLQFWYVQDANRPYPSIEVFTGLEDQEHIVALRSVCVDEVGNPKETTHLALIDSLIQECSGMSIYDARDFRLDVYSYGAGHAEGHLAEMENNGMILEVVKAIAPNSTEENGVMILVLQEK